MDIKIKEIKQSLATVTSQINELEEQHKNLQKERDEEEPSDDQLKWAIHMGIHNFGAILPDQLVPVEFRNIIYHMFSSGDGTFVPSYVFLHSVAVAVCVMTSFCICRFYSEVVLSACKHYVETDDNEVMDRMIKREWVIYCKNKDHSFNESDIEEVTSSTEGDGDVPNILLTAMAALVDRDKISEDRAAILIASAMRGNVDVKKVYDNFMKHGNCDEFLRDLETVVSDEQFTSSRALAAPTPTKSCVPPGFDAKKEFQLLSEATNEAISLKTQLDTMRASDKLSTAKSDAESLTSQLKVIKAELVKLKSQLSDAIKQAGRPQKKRKHEPVVQNAACMAGKVTGRAVLQAGVQQFPQKKRKENNNPNRDRTRYRDMDRHSCDFPLQPKPRDDGPPSVNLLVRNVSPDVTIEELRRAFGRKGAVRHVFIPQFHSGKPKRYAFIEYATLEEARDARDEMNGFVINGIALQVVYAREKRKTPNEMRVRLVNGEVKRDGGAKRG
eukprot:scaffold39184_cov22-Cyclotella_meneghiniana.AAC.1